MLDSRGRQVTRNELYKLVWSKPMKHLAADLGISGTGLAKICKRLDVPSPPLGYWEKKAAGKPVMIPELPAKGSAIPGAATIRRTPPAPPPPESAVLLASVTPVPTTVRIPDDDPADLHPRVRAWVEQHATEQKKRAKEIRQTRGSGSWFMPTPLADLTPRDLYRFRVTSALLFAVEEAEVKIKSAAITGKLTFAVSKHEIECSVVEKMRRSFKRGEEANKWTAYPEHHQGGLEPTGLLRVAILTRLGEKQPQWIEDAAKKIVDYLPNVVGTIVAAGPIIDAMNRERESWEEQARRERETAERARRRAQMDGERWKRFQTFASQWETKLRLEAFLSEIERRAAKESSKATIDGKTLDDWLAWARAKIDDLDPFAEGVNGLLATIGGKPFEDEDEYED